MRSNIAAALSAIAVFGFWFFLPFTQFRVADAGVSELMGVVCCVALAMSGRLPLAKESLTVFSLHVALMLFTFFGMFAGSPFIEAALRDVVAVSYSLVVVIALANLMVAYPTALTASVLGIFSAVHVTAITLIVALFSQRIPSAWWEAGGSDVDLLGDASAGVFSILPRFVGLSANPNQLAFFLAFAIFFVAAVTQFGLVKTGPLARRAFYFASVSLIAATQSDAGVLSLVFGVALIGGGIVLRAGPLMRATAVYMSACSLAVVGSLLWAWGSGDDGGNGRLPLWVTAGEVVDSAAGWGLGYGLHVSTPLGMMETHNTLIDMVLMGGVVGGLILAAILAVAVYRYFAFAGDWRVIPTLVVFCFLLTYSAIRTPIFWLALILPWVLDVAVGRVDHHSARGRTGVARYRCHEA